MGKKDRLTKEQKEVLTEIVINFVREHPVLYDKTHPDYRDNEKTKKKWKQFKETVNTSLKYKLKKGMLGVDSCSVQIFVHR